MDITPIHARVIGLDVHQAEIVACAIINGPDGTTSVIRRRFGAFKRDRRALGDWCASLEPEVVVMESTGIYWKSPYAALEKVGIRGFVVNARHVKKVPGRKTDIADAEWLAMLARAGLLRASFVPPERLRRLRLISRQRQKLVGMLAAEKNRLNKVMADAGLRLGTVVSDLHGTSARAMTEAIIGGATPEEALQFATHRLKTPHEEIAASLEGELSEEHRFVLCQLISHIKWLEAEIARFDVRLIEGLGGKVEQNAIALLQTVPGIDRIGAAMLLVEIGLDMSVFASSGAFASWAGICPGNNRSAGKRKRERVRKGNSYVRRLLCEFAHAAVKTRSAFQAKHKGLMISRGYKRSIIACAHKMLRTIHVMLSRNEPYRDSTVDYDALVVGRNAPRWIRALKRYGYLPVTSATR